MEGIIHFIEEILEYVVTFGAIALELIGIYVMLDAGFRGFKRWLKREEDGPRLEEGILEALEFMMCGEVLKTVTANNMNDYIALGAIIVLRFALAFEVQWEMKNKVWHRERSMKEKGSAEEK
ncbi:MAG: DUF1622 domain-containing protein [Solobacterium sp.]|nr:DUF1622 domain-containing protein [Solobacterium sp.]